MQRMLVVAVLVLAIRPTSAAPSKLPAHYAGLFEQGRAWTYDVSLTTWDYDKLQTQKRPPKVTEKVVIKCNVSRVETIGKLHVSEVKCDREYDRAFKVAGFYVADEAGLHHLMLDTFPAAEADLVPLAEPDIAAKPRAMHKVTKDDFFKAKMTDAIRKEGAAWCVYNDTSEFPDGGPVSICYANGIASGSDDTGGELHHVAWHVR